MKKTLCFILIFALAVISSTIVRADNEPATLTIQAPQGQVSVGDTVPVTLYITAVKPIGRVTATVTYDTSVLTFVSGEGAASNDGVITIDQLNGLGTSASISLNFAAAATGNAAVSVTSCAVFDAFEEQFDLQASAIVIEISDKVETTPTQTETFTQTTPQTDANGVPTQGVLVDLQIDHGSLVPPFMYSIYDYSVTVPYEVDRVEIDGKTASSQDLIWYTGNPECAVGQNLRTITVTDIYGNKTMYTIHITRLEKDEAQTTSVVQEPAAVQTSSSTESTADKQTAKKDDKDIKQTLLPALYIVLIVLVVALVIVIMWIKNKASKSSSDKKNERQRSKIKVSGSKNTKKKK